MNGKWFAAKALGTGKVSSGRSSPSMSSKLLVSSSPCNSGTTGGTAETQDQYMYVSFIPKYSTTACNYTKMFAFTIEDSCYLLSLRVSQFHWSFLKNLCSLISCTPFLPNRLDLWKMNRCYINRIEITYDLNDLLTEWSIIHSVKE